MRSKNFLKTGFEKTFVLPITTLAKVCGIKSKTMINNKLPTKEIKNSELHHE